MQSVDTAVTDLASAMKKFFRRVLPIMLVMLVCNQLNRSNIGYAQDHLQADVGIGAAAYGFGAGLFFIAYAIFELPSNVMMEKYGAKIWLTRIMVSWGIVSFLMAFVQNETMFYVLRFLLGAAEAGFFPAVIFYFARWVPAGQRGKATAVFIAGSSVAAALSGPIAGLLLSLHDVLGLRGWQWLFGFEGVLSVVVGITVFFFLDAKIQDAKWLTAGQKSRPSPQPSTAEDAQHTTANGAGRQGQPLEDAPEPADPPAVRHLLLGAALHLREHVLAADHRQADPRHHGPERRLPLLHPVGVRRLRHVLRGQVAGQGKVQAPAAGRRTPRGRRRHPRGSRRYPVFALVFLAIAAMGFKSASPLFWTIPQSALHPLVLAPAIAIINSLGNLGGFVAPFGFGIIKEQTGSVVPGLFALAAASTVAAMLVYFLKERKPASDVAEKASAPGTPRMEPSTAK
jgi:MFS family permease